MAPRLDRRGFLVGTAGTALAASLPRLARAQGKPVKIGLLTVKTGPLASGGIQMEQGKIQELVERDGVDMIFGPLAAFELLAITDYAAQAKMPILSLAAAEDMTQRKPNPYFVRASATSSQTMHPLADYAAKEMKLKRVI